MTERKMLRTQSVKFDVNKTGVDLLLGEFDHRMRNLLMMIEAMVRQTQSTSVEGYRAKLIARITGLSGFYQLASRYGRIVGLAELARQTVRPYAATDDQVLAAGPDLELDPPMAFALHLVFHELATNAKKYGALSSPFGRVEIEWKLRHVAGGPRKLVVVWTEQGGPEVKAPHDRGFGSRLIRTALEAYGGVRLDFNSTGLACFMLIDLDRTDARIELPASQ